MRETISVELTPEEVELIGDALNTASVEISKNHLERDGDGKLKTDGVWFDRWEKMGEIWGKFYDIKQQNKVVKVWK